MESSTAKKVLIVEDDRQQLLALAARLQEKGIVVDVAIDGEEGLAKTLAGNYDGVILDILMPKKDGITMLKEIREKMPESKTRFIILSNADDLDHIAEAVSYRAADYLVKTDMTLDALVTAIITKLSIA